MAIQLKTEKQIMGMITQVKNMGKKMDALIHETACQCLAHAAPTELGGHGDCRLMDRLISSLGKSVRAKGLQVWVYEFSPIRWNGDGKVGIVKEGTKLYKPWDLDTAEAAPFWTLEAAAERVVKPLTLEQLRAVVNNMDKRIDKAAEEGNIAEGETSEEMHEFVAKIKAVM